jgi:hypothetical protein
MPDENEQPAVDPLTVGELISLAEAAELSGFSHSYLKDIAGNRLPAKRLGRYWYTTMAAVEYYKENRNSKNIPKKYRERT